MSNSTQESPIEAQMRKFVFDESNSEKAWSLIAVGHDKGHEPNEIMKHVILDILTRFLSIPISTGKN